jgi:hypothetical protein
MFVLRAHHHEELDVDQQLTRSNKYAELGIERGIEGWVGVRDAV